MCLSLLTFNILMKNMGLMPEGEIRVSQSSDTKSLMLGYEID